MSSSPIRDQILAATDRLNALRRAFYQQQASYDDCAVAARTVLELRQQAEQTFYGKVKTKITPRSIASLIRSS
jgi:hypothetical protein